MREHTKVGPDAAKPAAATTSSIGDDTHPKVDMLEQEVSEVKQVACQAQEVTVMTALRLQNHVIEENERRRQEQRAQREAAGTKVVVDSQDGDEDIEVI